MTKTKYMMVILLALGQIQFASADNDGKGLEGLVAEWMKLMQERQQVEDKWRENKQILENTREGLKAEIAELNDDIKGIKDRSSKWDKDKEKQEAERKRYETAKEWLTNRLPELENRAYKMKNRFPESLLRGNVKLASAFEALTKRIDAEEPPKEGMSNRLNRVITILNEANKFNQTLKVVQEKREHGGKPVQLTVLYLGFSQAYATNEGQTVALHGTCGPDGWEFKQANEHASEIWQAIKMAKNEADVDFVPLPVKGK